MTSRHPKAKGEPTLLRPDSASYLAWRAEKERVEESWRTELETMSHEKLVELSLAAGWTVKLLEQKIEKLTKELSEHQSGRRKGGQQRRPDQKLAKEAIHQEWLRAQQSRKKVFVTRFAWEMIAKHKPAITNVETVIKWCRKWAEEAGVVSHIAVRSRTSVTSPPPAEIHRLVGYIDPDWVKKQE